LPPKKAARYRDKAKPLVCCANGFAMKDGSTTKLLTEDDTMQRDGLAFE
jgi:hypothetical protein